MPRFTRLSEEHYVDLDEVVAVVIRRPTAGQRDAEVMLRNSHTIRVPIVRGMQDRDVDQIEMKVRQWVALTLGPVDGLRINRA